MDQFISAIVADPDNDEPRLIYADHLDEQGDPRGRFIRLQCEYHECFRNRTKVQFRPCLCRQCLLIREEDEMLLQYGYYWVNNPVGWPVSMTMRNIVFKRGFIHSLDMNFKDWWLNADEILSGHSLLKKIKLNFSGGAGGSGWDGYRIVIEQHKITRAVLTAFGKARKVSWTDDDLDKTYMAVIWPGIEFTMATSEP